MADVHKTLAERGGSHGSFYEQSSVTERIKAAMRTGRNWNKLLRGSGGFGR